MSKFNMLFDLLGELARKRYQLAEQNFARVGLNHTEARILSLLSQQNGKGGQDDIGQRMNIDRSNVGRALKNLESRGLVSRSRSDEDRRAFMIELTQEGQELVVNISQIKKQIVDNFFIDMSEDEAAVIFGLLKKISD